MRSTADDEGRHMRKVVRRKGEQQYRNRTKNLQRKPLIKYFPGEPTTHNSFCIPGRKGSVALHNPLSSSWHIHTRRTAKNIPSLQAKREAHGDCMRKEADISITRVLAGRSTCHRMTMLLRALWEVCANGDEMVKAKKGERL
jgi:hypothetical protein